MHWYDAVNYVSELFSFDFKWLDRILECNDPEDSVHCILENSIENKEFLVSMYIVVVPILQLFLLGVCNVKFCYENWKSLPRQNPE